MANLLKKVERLIQEKTAVPNAEQLTTHVTWDDIREMPDGHMACPQCGGVWFELEKDYVFFRSGCCKCAWETELDIANYTDALGVLRCQCGCKKWALQKQWDIFCIGCKSCEFEVRMDIPPKSKLLWTPS